MKPEDIDDPVTDICSICEYSLRDSDTQCQCEKCGKAICEDCTCKNKVLCIGDDVYHKSCLSCKECVNYDPLKVMKCKLGNNEVCDKFKESEE